MKQVFHEEINQFAQFKKSLKAFRQPKYRILIVDDDADFSDSLSLQMQDRINCTITVATNPYEAMNALVESYFDFVILDWKLQNMSGGSALQKADKVLNIDTGISAQWDRAKVPVIIMSADEESEGKVLVSNHFRKIGFVNKMENLETFCENVLRLIGKSKAKQLLQLQVKEGGLSWIKAIPSLSM